MDYQSLFPNLHRAMKDNFPVVFARDYERLLTKIDRLWGTPEAPHYLNELIFPERSGRQGFPYKAMVELTAIKQTHDEEFPDLSIDMGDPFALLAHELAKAERVRGSSSKKGS